MKVLKLNCRSEDLTLRTSFRESLCETHVLEKHKQHSLKQRSVGLKSWPPFKSHLIQLHNHEHTWIRAEAKVMSITWVSKINRCSFYSDVPRWPAPWVNVFINLVRIRRVRGGRGRPLMLEDSDHDHCPPVTGLCQPLTHCGLKLIITYRDMISWLCRYYVITEKSTVY